METKGRGGNLAGADNLVAATQAVYDRAVAELRQWAARPERQPETAFSAEAPLA